MKNVNKYSKKLLSVILSVILIMTVVPLGVVSVDSATINETENNDSYASANNFSLNSIVKGKMSNSNDEDYYKISPSQNGKIALTFSHGYSSNSDVFWNITMYTFKSNQYTEFYNQRIYANSGETNKLASIGAASGTVYYIKISTYYDATVDFEYNLKNEFTNTSYYEKEINDEYSSATSMLFNQTYGGVMNDDNDTDVYKFTPTQNGKIALTFSHEYSSNNDIYWNVIMYEYSSGKYTEFYNQRIYASSGETNTLASIGASSDMVYYIKINTYYDATVGVDYSLKNVFTSTNYYEKEINDTYSSATSMSFDQTYGGVMNDDNDVDVYKFTPTQDGKISLNFLHDYSSNSDIYWNIVMYEYSSGNYTEFYNNRIYASSGEINKLPPIGASSGKVYFIKMSTYYDATIGFDYRLTNEFTPTNYYEKEINNEYASATPITLGASYGGVMNDDNDVDNYKITLTSSSIPFTFSHEYVDNSDVYWNVKIVDANTYSEKFSEKIYGSASNGVTTKFDQAGTYYIQISTYYDSTTNYEYSILVGNPDTTKPTGSITSSNNVESSQTVTLSLSDNVGIAGYYWGASSSYSNNTYTATSNTKVTKTISSSGTYYLTVKDTSGNISTTVSKIFYKTTLNPNGGSVTPTSVITMSGNSFTFPTPTKSESTYQGWSTSSTASSGVKSLTPTSNTTYYAIWTTTPSDTTKPTGSISSTNNVASSQTVTLSLSDNVGIAGYYWGTSSSYANNTYTTSSNSTINKTISSSGTYYLTVKDTSGNISTTVSKTFYKTTLNANGGSVTPTSVITMSGNSFTFPTPTHSNSSYSYQGWSTSSTATSGIKSISPSGNTTYYAIWKQITTPVTDASVNVSTVKGTAGSTVDVPISLSNNPGIVAMTLNVTYNTSVLTLVDVKDAGVLGSSSHKPEKTSPYTLSWANDTATTNYTVNGTIATLSFKIKDGASVGTYPITVTYDYNNYGIYDKDLNKLSFNMDNGAVEVIDVIYGDVNSDGIVNSLDRVYLTRYLANWNDYKKIDMDAADVNCDGTVNSLDRVILTRYLANWSAYSQLPYEG